MLLSLIWIKISQFALFLLWLFCIFVLRVRSRSSFSQYILWLCLLVFPIDHPAYIVVTLVSLSVFVFVFSKRSHHLLFSRLSFFLMLGCLLSFRLSLSLYSAFQTNHLVLKTILTLCSRGRASSWCWRPPSSTPPSSTPASPPRAQRPAKCFKWR